MGKVCWLQLVPYQVICKSTCPLYCATEVSSLLLFTKISMHVGSSDPTSYLYAKFQICTSYGLIKTEELDQGGVIDISHYYLSPILNKFLVNKHTCHSYSAILNMKV